MLLILLIYFFPLFIYLFIFTFLFSLMVTVVVGLHCSRDKKGEVLYSKMLDPRNKE